MRKLANLILILPLVWGVMSGIYSHRQSKKHEPIIFSPDFLSTKADEILDNPISIIDLSQIEPGPAQETTNPVLGNPLPSRAERPKRVDLGEFTATAYDLSVGSCGKGRNHPLYGITASGKNITGMDIRDKLIATDKNYFPFGTKLFVEFPEKIRYLTFNGEEIDLNGEYTVVDRGGAITGRRIDIFFGEDEPGDETINRLCFKFGVQQVKVYEIGG